MFGFSRKKESIIKKGMLNKLQEKIDPMNKLPPNIYKFADMCIDRVGATNILKAKEIFDDISNRDASKVK